MRVLTRPRAAIVAALISSVPILVAVGAPAQAAPATIAITTPADGSRTDDWTPQITGTSDVISGTITVRVDLGRSLTLPTNATGDWILAATPNALVEGSHTALATATDATGILATDSTTFIVDLTQKRPKLRILTPAFESATNDSTPTISGISDVISGTITVAIDDGPQVTVPTNATGDWKLIPTRLSDGQHFAVARAVNADGYTETGPATFLVDATPPVFAITTPVNGSTTQDPTPTITGTFDPDMERGFSRFGTITVTIDGGAPITFKNNTSRAGIITGNWRLSITTALGNGPRDRGAGCRLCRQQLDSHVAVHGERGGLGCPAQLGEHRVGPPPVPRPGAALACFGYRCRASAQGEALVPPVSDRRRARTRRPQH